MQSVRIPTIPAMFCEFASVPHVHECTHACACTPTHTHTHTHTLTLSELQILPNLSVWCSSVGTVCPGGTRYCGVDGEPASSLTCVPIDQYCDGVVNCPNGLDESSCLSEFIGWLWTNPSPLPLQTVPSAPCLVPTMRAFVTTALSAVMVCQTAPVELMSQQIFVVCTVYCIFFSYLFCRACY